MNITLQGTNLELSETLRSYVNEKIHDAFRAFGDMDLEPVEVAVELEVTTRRHRKDERLYRAEANIALPGRMLRAEATSDDMYKAITRLKHTLMRSIREWRERLIDENREGARLATTLPGVAEPQDLKEEIWELWEEPVAEDLDDEWQEGEELGEDERDYV